METRRMLLLSGMGVFFVLGGFGGGVGDINYFLANNSISFESVQCFNMSFCYLPLKSVCGLCFGGSNFQCLFRQETFSWLFATGNNYSK
jgi:hypothetical protein